MPNGGITPDCIHCKLVKGTLPEPLECSFHKMRLAYPIRVFCANFADQEPDYDWSDLTLSRDNLDTEIMYVWLEIRAHDKDGKPVYFKYEPLTSISEFKSWTTEKLLETLGDLAIRKHEEYRALGYDFDPPLFS